VSDPTVLEFCGVSKWPKQCQILSKGCAGSDNIFDKSAHDIFVI